MRKVILIGAGCLLVTGVALAAVPGIRANRENAHGRTCLMANDVQCAVAAFSHAASLKPDVPKYHYNLGIALARLGAHEQAAVEFRSALKIDPAFPNARRGLELSIRAVDQGHADRIADEIADRLRH